MTSPTELTTIGEHAKRDFEAGRHEAAADGFRRAARGYSDLGDQVNEAEQKNNLSVTLLQLRRPEQALEEAAGTDGIFAGAGDRKRQGMALNNQAAALQELRREKEALAAYEGAALLLGEAGESQMRAMALKAAAAIHLRRGRMTAAGLNMLGALGSTTTPTLLERALRWLLSLSR